MHLRILIKQNLHNEHEHACISLTWNIACTLSTNTRTMIHTKQLVIYCFCYFLEGIKRSMNYREALVGLAASIQKKGGRDTLQTNP
jgi:hypothetical protein